MQTVRFHSLVRVSGPLASVYFDDSHDTLDAVERLETTWRNIRTGLEDRNVDQDVIAVLESAVRQRPPTVGRRGRALIATRDRVLVDESLTSPPPETVLRWSDYPYLVPLIELEMRYPTYVLAAVDRTGAEVTVHQGDVVKSETVAGGGYPVHKPVTAGWSGYGDFQRTTDEAIRMNVRAVVDHLTAVVDETDPEVVFLGGEMRSRTAVLSALPLRVAERVSQLHAGARTRGVDDDKIQDLIAAEFTRRRDAEMADAAERFQAQAARRSGLAAEGLAAVCAGLRAGDVDTLIVGELGSATVVAGEARTTIAPDADALSELGEPVQRVVRADEALPFAAVAVGARLVRADPRLTPADGIGALLRYAPVASSA